MKLSLAVGLVSVAIWAGCGSGGTVEPVTVTTMALDATTSVESTGHVVVPEEDFQPTGCNGLALAPQPAVLAEDFAALDAATTRAHADSAPTTVTVVIGHYTEEGLFGEVEVKGRHQIRQNYVAGFSISSTDEAGQAALKDLLSSIKDAR